MPGFDLVKDVAIPRTPRVVQLEGLFDIAPHARAQCHWKGELPLETQSWNIGAIVGPSGSGKTSIARDVFPAEAFGDQLSWPRDAAVIDAFPDTMGIKDIVKLLSSVGFGSPPSWLKPFRVLSNGEQFRASIALALASIQDLVVVDEFTSVVDRTVAKIASAAVAKGVREQNRQFVAVSCHEDIVEWLQPDWIYQPHLKKFQWRYLQRRPPVALEVHQVDRQAWDLFKSHHYLSATLSTSARCFLGTIDQQPAAFCGVVSFCHGTRSGWRAHRTVCLPDFQGIGIGNRLVEFVAGMYISTGKPFYATTGHPALTYYRARSPMWKMNRKPSIKFRQTFARKNRTPWQARLTAGFEYIGPPFLEDGIRFGISRDKTHGIAL